MTRMQKCIITQLSRVAQQDYATFHSRHLSLINQQLQT